MSKETFYYLCQKLIVGANQNGAAPVEQLLKTGDLCPARCENPNLTCGHGSCGPNQTIRVIRQPQRSIQDGLYEPQ